MNSSPVRGLAIIVFIVIVISGKHDGLSDAKYRINDGHKVRSNAEYSINDRHTGPSDIEHSISGGKTGHGAAKSGISDGYEGHGNAKYSINDGRKGQGDAKYRISNGHESTVVTKNSTGDGKRGYENASSVGRKIQGVAKHSISGYEGFGSAKYRICYKTQLTKFCADLQPSENVTSQDKPVSSETNFNANLMLRVYNATKLDLSANVISNLRFYDSGTIDLETGLPCLFFKDCLKEFNEKCPRPALKCAQFQYEYPEKLISSKAANVTKNIRTLILSYNSMKNISNIFAPLGNLEKLDLSYNLIEYVSDEAFANNSKLVTLRLHNNLIESLRKETFEHLRNLQTLDLSSNRFTRLNLDIFEYLSDLLVLRISDNFHFANGPEQSSSFIFSAGQKFERLEMTGTSLSKIPIVLTRSIRELDLSNNSLVLIQRGDMDSYPLLQRLSLNNNKLKMLEEDSLGRLEYLIELNLNGNNLYKIPLSLPISLLRLDLGFNKVRRVNKTDLGELTHLTSLILRDNRIEYLEEGVFASTVSLEHLDLSNNPIKQLTSGVFAGPKSIINLQLSNLSKIECEDSQNCIKTFPFTEVERLEVIDLSSSPLLSKQLILDQSIMLALGHLRELNLVNTNLTQLNPEMVYNLRRLQILRVHHNPFNCSIDLIWLSEWLRNLKRNNLKGACLENQNTTIEDSDTRGFATIRVTLPQNEGATEERLGKQYESITETPFCFSPPTLHGKSLLELPAIGLKEQTSKLQNERDSIKPFDRESIVGNLEKDKSNADIIIKDDKSAKSSSINEEKIKLKASSKVLVRLEPGVKESSIDALENVDKGKSVSNSVLPDSEKIHDEVFYQNDEPKINTESPREKTGSYLKAVRNFEIMHNQETQYTTVQPKAALRDEIVQSINRNQEINSSLPQISKVAKQEVKSINKTHIEISRSGQRNKTSENKKVMPDPDKKGPKVEENAESGGEQSLRKTFSNNTTPFIQTSFHNNVSQSNISKTGGLKNQNPLENTANSDRRSVGIGMLSTPTVKSMVFASTVPTERKRARGKNQDLNVSQVFSKISTDQNTPTAFPMAQTTRKTKSLDEKSESSPKPGRKKLGKKLKDTTTIQPEMLQSLTPTFDPTTNPTSRAWSMTKTSFESSLEKVKAVEEKSYKNLTPITKKIEEKPVAGLMSEIDVQNHCNNTTERKNATNGADNANINNDNIGNAYDTKNCTTDKRIKTTILVKTGKTMVDVEDLFIKDISSTTQKNERANKTNKNSKQLNVANRDKLMNIGKKQTPENDSSHKKAVGKQKEDNDNILHNNKNNGQDDINRTDDKTKKNEGTYNAADVHKDNGRDVIKKNDVIHKPIKEELRVNNGKIEILVPTSSENPVANANKYNSNLENSDGLEKGGSHPGMFIFLLVVSILLFTLSLMLISHWTWCKRLNVYELGDRQILDAESDYEINSLTNFKDHDRW